MKTNKKITILVILLVIILPSLTLAYSNSRLGDPIDDFGEKGLDLETCYYNGGVAELDLGLSFVSYYEKYVDQDLPLECQDYLEITEITIEEFSEENPGWYLQESDPVDSDGDGFTDMEEKGAETDPNNNKDFPWWIDVDGDGYSNQFEITTLSDPENTQDVPSPKYIVYESKEELTKVNNNWGWQVYLAFGLAILLIIFIIIYIVYYEGYSK